MQVFLETERLVLRRFTEADVDNLFDLDSDPEVMRFLTGGKPTPRDVIGNETLPRFLRYYERLEGFGFWAAIEKSTGEFLGWFEFRPQEGGGPGEVELGYRLKKSAWGRGYATEGSRALIRKGFTELGVQRAWSFSEGEPEVLYNIYGKDLSTGEEVGLSPRTTGQYRQEQGPLNHPLRVRVHPDRRGKLRQEPDSMGWKNHLNESRVLG
jgi:RimJ/RimL family protein N-acetyltransferase